MALRQRWRKIWHPDSGLGQRSALFSEHDLCRTIREHATTWSENDHPVDEPKPHVHAVFNDNQGGTGALQYAAHRVSHPNYPRRVEVCCRLVEQQQTRLHGEDAGKGEPLLLAPGELVCRMPERQVKSDGVECFAHSGPDLLTRDPKVLASERHVVADGGENHLTVRVLQHQASTAARGRGGRAIKKQLPLLVAVLAPAPAQNTSECVNQRRLSCTRRPEQ